AGDAAGTGAEEAGEIAAPTGESIALAFPVGPVFFGPIGKARPARSAKRGVRNLIPGAPGYLLSALRFAPRGGCVFCATRVRVTQKTQLLCEYEPSSPRLSSRRANLVRMSADRIL